MSENPKKFKLEQKTAFLKPAECIWKPVNYAKGISQLTWQERAFEDSLLFNSFAYGDDMTNSSRMDKTAFFFLWGQESNGIFFEDDFSIYFYFCPNERV